MCYLLVKKSIIMKIHNFSFSSISLNLTSIYVHTVLSTLPYLQTKHTKSSHHIVPTHFYPILLQGCHCVTVTQFVTGHYVIVLLYYSVTELLCNRVTVPWCSVSLWQISTFAMQPNCIPLPICYCVSVSLCHCV